MFEKYTEQARRVIFFARYEASECGSASINPEHVLLGLLRENREIVSRLLSPEKAHQIQQEIEKRVVVGKKTSISVEMPLSEEAKRVLDYAAEESDQMVANYVGPEHILLGLLRDEKSLAAEILYQKGLRADRVREIYGAETSAPELTVESAAGFRIQHIDHVALSVADVDRSAAWYQEVLGLQRHDAWKIPVMVCAGSTCVALFPAGAAETQRPDRNAAGMRHLAFRVDRLNFKRAQEALRHRGLEFKFEDHGIAHSIYLSDPDGNEIEITTYEV